MMRGVTGRGLLILSVVVILGGVLLTGCGAGTGPGTGEGGSFALIIAALTFVAAFGGGALPLLGRMDHQHRLLGSLTSISAGFLIAAACLIVIPEGFERLSMAVSAMESESETEHAHDHEDHAGHDHGESAHVHAHGPGGLDASLSAGLALLAGFLLMLVTESLGFGHDIHEEHHNHQGGHVHHPVGGGHGKHLAAVVVIGLTIHTIADGMAIGAGLATGSHALTGSLVVTLLTHKIPAAVSLTLFSQHAHGNRRRTWIDLLIFSLATPAAILLTRSVLGTLSDFFVGWVLLFSAGTFIYVATIDVLPNVLQTSTRRQAALHVIGGCLALLVVILLFDALGFSLHDHG